MPQDTATTKGNPLANRHSNMECTTTLNPSSDQAVREGTIYPRNRQGMTVTLLDSEASSAISAVSASGITGASCQP